jgi:hypothetical protein
MFQNFKYQNIKYSLVKVKDIINIYTIPKCQRISLHDRIKHLDKHMFFSFKPITPIYFVLFNNKKYIIDGLHRLNVYKNNTRFLDEKIPIVEIQVHEEKEIDIYFKLINDNMTVHDVYLNHNEDVEMEDINQKNNIIIETHKYFIEKYPNSFKYNGRRRPFLNNNLFLDHLEIIYDKKKDNIKNTEDLITIILDLNKSYKKQNINWFPSKSKVNNENLIKIIQDNNCLYFGMLPKDWFLYIDNFPDYISEEKISQCLRQQIWTINCKNQNQIRCLCCNINYINAFTFECGHIIASSKGGKCNIRNLVPICNLCNKSMSNTDMEDFMLKNNFKTNLDLIKKLKYNQI